jgi:uncharacterized damage-inducible protein DinB
MELPLTDHFRAMARNNAWSNYRLHRACAQLTPAEYRAERTSFFPSIQLTLTHIFAVDRFYLDTLEAAGRAPGIWHEVEPFERLTDLTAAQSEADRRLIAYCDALSENGLSSIVLLDRSDGIQHREQVHAVLSHLFVHQIHHRGQAHAMLAGTSVAPPQLDEFFLDWDAPLRAGDFAALGFAEGAQGRRSVK